MSGKDSLGSFKVSIVFFYSGIAVPLQVLRDQGLGKYCDPEFVRAASREMQEAMDMTPEEFDQAAHRLLQAEKAGHIKLPLSTAVGEGRRPTSAGGGGAGARSPGAGGASARWAGGAGAADEAEFFADEDEETIPLRQPPARFTAPARQPGDRGAAAAGLAASPTQQPPSAAAPSSASAAPAPPTPSPTASAGQGAAAAAAAGAAGASSTGQRRPRGRSRTTPDRGGDRGGVPESQRGKDFRRDPVL